jgi:hypothetical protein
MSRRPVLVPWLVLVLSLLVGLAGCKGDYGGVQINLTLVADTMTRCLKAWAETRDGKRSESEAVARNGDSYVFGLRGSEELV